MDESEETGAPQQWDVRVVTKEVESGHGAQSQISPYIPTAGQLLLKYSIAACFKQQRHFNEVYAECVLCFQGLLWCQAIRQHIW